MTKLNNFYITTPIYYPSAKPHMGHAYSSIVADVFARFNRLDGKDVFYLTGTDEHGLKIQRAAEKSNLPPKEFCNKISKTFKDLTKTLNLSNNDFIRTTENRHYKSVKAIWDRLVKSGDIYLSKYSGWYSVSDEAYYDEEEIEDRDGTKCAKLSGSKVDWVEEESFFFKLSKWGPLLLEHYKKNPDFILPSSRKNEVVEFVKSGLKDLSVSRTSFKWGIPVPNSKDHVIYVWLDALVNYLSALNFPDEKDKLYKKFWPASVHIIGKDILRFHAVYWPAFLLAAKLPLPHRIYGHGWILSGEKKMSKSLGNILDPLEIIKRFGIDPLRYYLIKEVSLGNDGNVSMENLKNCINNDLANNFGNLCQRVFTFLEKNCSKKIPKVSLSEKKDKEIIDKTINHLPNLIGLMEKQELNLYIKQVVDLSFEANKYFNDLQPWSLKKTDTKRMDQVLYTIINQIKNIAILLSPIIPESSEKIFKILNIKSVKLSDIKNDKILDFNKPINRISILFKKIEDK